MRKLDFYEFAAIALPGSVLLIAVGLLFCLGDTVEWLAPGDFGSLGVHLILAYVVGHLLQAVGNGLEELYWKLWGGLPTDWPLTRPSRLKVPGAKRAMSTLMGKKPDSLDDWRFGISQARTTICASDRGERLSVMNGNYGLFRGLLAAALVLAAAAWASDVSWWLIYSVLLAGAVLTACRMHRFALYYARELFAGLVETVRLEEQE